LLLLLIVYLGPLIAGAILVFFMIKPLFARRTVTHFPLSLARRDEPLLFAFVERLCEVVGAPRPSRIDVDTDVNASASFREGFWGFLKKDLVLTVGLPLVAGMNLRQFTGVLAHEFGHFAQGTGMRVTYLIRAINGWFARVVYERDSWDEWLVGAAQGADHWAFQLIVGLSRLFVWLTRRVLWVLMILGHGVSSFMLRQMEFDADRYQARVTGSQSFAPMMEKVEMIGLAARAAFNDLESAWREKRLCDDLPALIRSREPDIPKELRTAIAEANKTGKTGWFDTHPSHADRTKSAARQNVPGVFTLDVPAETLFQNIADLSRRATVAFYHQTLGDAVQREHLVPTESLVVDRSKKKESLTALSRYFQDLVHPVRSVFPNALTDSPRDPVVAAETLLELRCKLTEAAPQAAEAAEQYQKADERLIAVAVARALRSAGERVDAKELKFSRADETELSATFQAATAAKARAETVLTEVLGDAVKRLELALSLEPKPNKKKSVETAPENDWGEYELADEPASGSGDRLLDALRALRAAAPHTESLRQHFYQLGMLLSRLRPEHNSESLIAVVLRRSEKVCADLSALHAELRSTPYPFEHAEQNVTMARYAIPAVPVPQQVGHVHRAAEAALDGCYGVYMRILSALAERAERVEQSLGLPPMPQPAEKDEGAATPLD
jgi:hypothetical protein